MKKRQLNLILFLCLISLTINASNMLAAKGKQILAADQKRFYSTRNMLWLSATLASGAVLANTKVGCFSYIFVPVIDE